MAEVGEEEPSSGVSVLGFGEAAEGFFQFFHAASVAGGERHYRCISCQGFDFFFIHFLGQVVFIKDDHGFSSFQGRKELPVFFFQGMGAVDDGQYQICLFHGFFGSFNADFFYFIIGFPKAGGIHEHQGDAADFDGFFDGVSGGAGDVGDNGPVFLEKGIEEAGFACVGAAHNGGAEAVFDDSSFFRPFQQGGKALFDTIQSFPNLLIGQIFQVFFGIVDGYFQLGNEVCQLVPAHFHKAGQGAGKVAFRLGQGGGAPGFDNVHHRFCLGEVQPAVKKGSFGKFAAAGREGAVFQSQLQGLPESFGGAVNLDFHHVFAGVGMGCLHVHRQPFIYPLALPNDMAEVEPVRLGLMKGCDFFRMKQGIRHIGSLTAADADNAYAPFAGGGGYGCNGCFFVHMKLLKENRLKFIYLL